MSAEHYNMTVRFDYLEFTAVKSVYRGFYCLIIAIFTLYHACDVVLLVGILVERDFFGVFSLLYIFIGDDSCTL